MGETSFPHVPPSGCCAHGRACHCSRRTSSAPRRGDASPTGRVVSLGCGNDGTVIYAVVLAAGASSRYGVSPPKQQELLPEVLAALHQSTTLDGILVVLGAHEVATDGATIRCPDWADGPGASLRCGLGALPAEVHAAVVVLADGPELD